MRAVGITHTHTHGHDDLQMSPEGLEGSNHWLLSIMKTWLTGLPAHSDVTPFYKSTSTSLKIVSSFCMKAGFSYECASSGELWSVLPWDSKQQWMYTNKYVCIQSIKNTSVIPLQWVICSSMSPLWLNCTLSCSKCKIVHNKCIISSCLCPICSKVHRPADLDLLLRVYVARRNQWAWTWEPQTREGRLKVQRDGLTQWWFWSFHEICRQNITPDVPFSCLLWGYTGGRSSC